jgi:hypothetical protein
MDHAISNEIEWKPIDGFEGIYSISNRGDVFSHRRGIVLKAATVSTGYLGVCLYHGDKRLKTSIHRLVAKAFIPNPEHKPTVNHINEDKTDNRVENLEWATYYEQNHHGTRSQRVIENTDYKKRSANMDYKAIASKHDYENMNVKQMKPVAQIDEHGTVIAVYKSISFAGRSTNISAKGIWRCTKGIRKRCGGFKWVLL